MCDRLSIQCIIPPFINDKLAQSTNPTVRARAFANIRAAATLRTQRVMSQAMPGLVASAAPTKKRQRIDVQRPVVRVQFTQSGGSVGAIRECTLDTSSIDANEATTLETLVKNADLFGAW